MSEAQHTWIQESIRTVRSLPLAQAILFLRGLLMSCHDTEASDEIRKIYTVLSDSDRQLQLIEDGQLRLNFERLTRGDLPESPEFPASQPPPEEEINPQSPTRNPQSKEL